MNSMHRNGLRALLLVSSALTASGLGSAAFAQAPAPAKTNSNALEEVVVTATRQTSTVNKVALSVSAVTQKSLDQQGIRSVADLSQQVPGFTFRTNGNDSIPLLTIRGIGGSAIASTAGGAPTTGVYIDDVPLQKRNISGAVSGSGTPAPLLYDLDRIEVLRGPQGTLYGGSSEGGTLRFITPTPSLTTYSGQMRVGVNTVAGGGIGDEEGIALGGPIIQDKLGFRIAGFSQDRAGWVNEYSEFDGHQFASGVNKGNDYSLRASLLWQVTPDFKATLSVLNQMTYDQNNSTVRTSSPAINIPVRTLANCSIKGLTAANTAAGQPYAQYAACGTTGVQGVSFSFPASTFGGYTVPATPWLSNSARNGNVNGLYLSPTQVQYMPGPRREIFTIPTLTLEYNWRDKLNFKSITAYDQDTTGGDSFTGGNGERTSNLPYINGQPCPSGTGMVTPINLVGSQTLANGCMINTPYLQFGAAPTVPGQPSPNPTGQAGPANTLANFFYRYQRNQTTQEFRVSTTDPSWRFQFVAGVFISHDFNRELQCAPYSESPWAEQLRGPNAEAYYNGALNLPICENPTAPVIDIAPLISEIVDDEQAVFGEASFAITSKLKITAGARVTNYNQNYYTQYGGAVSGGPPGWVGSSSSGQTITVGSTTSPLETNPKSTTPFANNLGACPTSPHQVKNEAQALQYGAAGCPYQYTVGTLNERPITPKVGLSYQLTDADLLYATYSEGERPGGINAPASPILCAPTFALLGITEAPPTYQHDTVKSTEVGGKFRLFDGQAQINTSAFHIEWDGVQFVVPLPSCTGFSFVANAGKAASDGAELQATGRFMGFTVNGNVAYDNARFTQSVYGPHAAGTAPTATLANKGDNLGIPDWTANFGVQYDWRVMDFPGYVRADYAYQGKYMRANSAGTTGFVPAVTPNYINGNETHIINARVGIYYKTLEIAGYVKNAADSREWINKTQAPGNYYYTGNTVVPRIIGMQMNYKF